MRRSIAYLAALGMAAVGLNLAVAPSASAGDYGCPGSQIGSYNLIGTNNEVWSTAYLYYSSADGGTNCASLVAKKFAGTRHQMKVAIWLGDGARKTDDGNYVSYAGPVSKTSSNGHCVSLSLSETDPRDGSWAGRTVDDVACG
jgi:hypothetical protein